MARNFFNELYEEVANGLQDIRHKVVEEPYFGREVTGHREQSEPVENERLWGSSTRHIEPELGAYEREPEHDIDIDR
jgi:hypothetical protein